MSNIELAPAPVTPRIGRDDPPLGKTRSLCPVCLEPVDASYRGREDAVWLVKNCPEHGEFAVPLWQGASGFLEWRASQNPAQRPKNPQSRPSRGCPYDCGLCENHLQATCCVLLELTGRCDLGCPVCFASAGQAASADPPLETIAFWYGRLMEQGGPFNIQLSGGEPTLRDDLPQIIRMGKDRGFTFFQLNTNGLRIARDREYLSKLAEAGLNTVFLQFDSLDGDHCAALRGRDLVAEKIRAVKNCAEAGVGVVLTPTIRRGVNDGDLWSILEFAADNMPAVRGVHFQPMSFFGRYRGDPVTDRLTIPALLKGIEEQSAGTLRARDFLPGGAEHPLCSFHANYTVKAGNWTPRQSAGNSGCCGSAAATAAESCCGASAPAAEPCCGDNTAVPAADPC
ncbi:MAG: radical SAM protein [Treponema sp.]|jgi:uncharacterized radical SAM superfamily Fe-S cluster-containing enzyme|nr:radical SAM protein [Treponema sp.]